MSGYDVLANGKRYFFKAPEWDTGRKHAPAAPPCGWDEFTRRLTMTLIEYFGHPAAPDFQAAWRDDVTLAPNGE